MVTAYQRQQFASDLRILRTQAQQSPAALDALSQHVAHLAPDDRRHEAEDLCTAAHVLTRALALIIEDSEPGVPVRWTISGKPVPRTPYCLQCAAGAGR